MIYVLNLIYQPTHLHGRFGKKLNYLDLENADQILDFGASSCETSSWLAAQGYNVTAFDICHESLIFSGIRDQGKSIQHVVGDCESTPFANQSFSKVICWNILHHLPYPEKAINELCRIVQSNGMVLILEPNARNLVRRLREPYRKNKGTLEKSFHSKWLYTKLERDFAPLVHMHETPPEPPPFLYPSSSRRKVMKLYYKICSMVFFKPFFGEIFMIVKKGTKDSSIAYHG